MATVQQCLMAAPASALMFFVDRGVLPYADSGASALCARIVEVARVLRARGVEVVVPAAGWVRPHLDRFRDEGLAVEFVVTGDYVEDVRP